MSGYDLAIWFSDVAVSREQAESFLQHVFTDWIVVRRHPSFDAFWIELHERFPDTTGDSDHLAALDSPPIATLSSLGEIEWPRAAGAGDAKAAPISLDETVWASGPHAAHGCTALLSVAWSHAAEVVPQILDLAGRHGLTVYDTQSGDIASPPGLVPGSGPEGARLRLDVAGSTPALDIRILLDGQPVASFAVKSRQDAHDQARSVAVAHGLPLYEVADPGSLAQRFVSRPKPISVDDPDLSAVGKFLTGFEGVPAKPK
ncbi:hypothetical protein QFZ27_004813 [Inquilinus ginsengisoli]|uniref:hypothetical protein n=1 Tax=Inquilinus ginsengisoli TaxID=363840 RepID=UPI003D1CB6A5